MPILPRFTEKPGGGAEILPTDNARRLVLRQIERLVRNLNEVKDQLVPKSSKKLTKKNEQEHKQDGEERGVT